jgi:argininosuccinate lyase
MGIMGLGAASVVFMVSKIWGGAFDGKTEVSVTKYMSGENVVIDHRLVEYDLLASIAHVWMLGNCGIIRTDESRTLQEALRKLLRMYYAGGIVLKEEYEDVHMNMEVLATELTPLGKKMHTARSRNDQVGTDMRMCLRDSALASALHMHKAAGAFASLAKKKDGPMPYYTHTRVAQPSTLSHWCESHMDGFERDAKRMMDAYRRINVSPLGACAGAGTEWNIDRNMTANALGFSAPIRNSRDAIGSRGEPESEFVFCLCATMTRASRIAEEIIWLSEKGLIKIPDKYTTGSSIMPNKKNPDVFELMRGRCARVQSNLAHLMCMMKGTMSGHNADTQESKFAAMSACDNTAEALAVLAEIIPQLEIDFAVCEMELKRGYANATSVADLLVANGMPFRDAHHFVGELVKRLSKEGRYLEDSSALIEKMAGKRLPKLRDALSLRKKHLVAASTPDGALGAEIERERERIGHIYKRLGGKACERRWAKGGFTYNICQAAHNGKKNGKRF